MRSVLRIGRKRIETIGAQCRQNECSDARHLDGLFINISHMIVIDPSQFGCNLNEFQSNTFFSFYRKRWFFSSFFLSVVGVSQSLMRICVRFMAIFFRLRGVCPCAPFTENVQLAIPGKVPEILTHAVASHNRAYPSPYPRGRV